MDNRARFGDFLRTATGCLDAAEPGPRKRTTHAEIRDATSGLLCLVTAMTGCINVTEPNAGHMPWRNARQPATWTQARVDGRRALENAVGFLSQQAHRQPRSARPSISARARSGPPSVRLASAALALQAGQDLLQTHSGRRPGGARQYRSTWAPVIASEHLSAAMLTELSSLAHRAAARGSGIALAPGPPGSWAARKDLNTACQWLWVFVNTVRAAHREQPVTASMRDLLREIHVNVLPERRIPVGGETIADLCAGTTSTAERITELAPRFSPQAAWSPAMTIISLHRSASAATVTSHNCELLLATLADAAAAGSQREHLLQAAEAAGRSRQAWLAAARPLDDIITDTRGYLSPHAVEMSDLSLWTGRLAFADPDWTPAAGPRHPTRPPSDLIPTTEAFRGVVSAVHYACDTLVGLADATDEQLQAAGSAARIVVPTRSLPDTIDILHVFAPAPESQVAALRLGYRAAARTSEEVTRHIRPVAESVLAPSQTLATASEAARAGRAPPRHVERARREIEAAPEDHHLPGPLERTLRQLGAADPAFLQQASALDREGMRLVTRAVRDLNAAEVRSVAASINRSLESSALLNHLHASGTPALPPESLPPPNCQHQAEPGR